MKSKLLLCLLISLPFLSVAQITLTAQLPNNGILLKDQLWNLVIVNNSNDIAVLKLQLDLRDISIGQSVINANTGNIIIGKGLKSVTINDIQPILYNYISSEFSGNYLPCGAYLVTYHLIAETSKGDVPVAVEVVRVNISPLSPPLLVNPADQSSIETVYPQFNWVPPTPMQMFNPLEYELLVVAVEEGQSAKEALEFNKPAYSNINLLNTSEKMPTSYEQLKQGQTYAWQVIARSGNSCAAQTEVWTFTIGKDSIKKIIESAPFVKISKSNTEVTVVHQGLVKMEYFNPGGDRKVSFHIYKAADQRTNKILVVEFELPLAHGQNFLQYNLAKKTKLEEKTVYEVSMINGRGEEWLMRFVPVYYKK